MMPRPWNLVAAAGILAQLQAGFVRLVRLSGSLAAGSSTQKRGRKYSFPFILAGTVTVMGFNTLAVMVLELVIGLAYLAGLFTLAALAVVLFVLAWSAVRSWRR